MVVTTLKTPKVTVDYFNVSWLPLTGLINLNIKIPSLATGGSYFSAEFNDKNGRISNDIFNMTGTPLGEGVKIRFIKDGTDLFYGRIWGIRPKTIGGRETIVLTGKSFDRELEFRHAKAYYARGNVSTNLVSMLADANAYNVAGLGVQAFKDLKTSVISPADPTPTLSDAAAPEKLEARDSRGVLLLDFIKDMADAWAVDGFIKYNLDSTHANGAEVNLHRVVDSGLSSALKTTKILKSVKFAQDNDIIDVDITREPETIRNFIVVDIPLPPGRDVFTEDLAGWSTLYGNNSLILSDAAIRGNKSINVRRSAGLTGACGVKLTLATIMGTGFTNFDLLFYNIQVFMFDYRQFEGAVHPIKVRLKDSQNRQIESTLARDDTGTIWSFQAKRIGNTFIGVGLDWQFVAPAVAFDWQIKEIEFDKAAEDSSITDNIFIDNMYFYPVSTYIAVYDSTSITKFGFLPHTIPKTTFTTAQSYLDYATGVLANFKDPAVYIKLKTTVNPVASGNLFYPGYSLRANIPRYGLDGTKYLRIVDVEYVLDNKGFFTHFGLVPAEAI